VADANSARAREPRPLGTRAVATTDMMAIATPYTAAAAAAFPTSTSRRARVRRLRLPTPWGRPPMGSEVAAPRSAARVASRYRRRCRQSASRPRRGGGG